MAKKAKGPRTYRSIPYNKIQEMWNEGKSYEQIAKGIKRFDPQAEDPTKPTRAIVSRMLNEGWTDAEGKKHTLKVRDGMRAIGVGKKSKPAKVAKTKPVKAAKPIAAKGGAVVISLTDGGQFVRVKVGKTTGKLPLEAAKPQMVGVLDTMGFAVVSKEPVTPVDTPASVEEALPPTGTDAGSVADAA